MRKGFTLIELLVVIGVIAILAVIVLVAVNPARQFSQARNAQRTSDVTTVLNAIHQNAVDNNGVLPNDNAGAVIAVCGVGVTTAANLSTALAPTYVSAIPADPQAAAYNVCRDANNRVTVTAAGTEIPPAANVISVTR